MKEYTLGEYLRGGGPVGANFLFDFQPHAQEKVALQLESGVTESQRQNKGRGPKFLIATGSGPGFAPSLSSTESQPCPLSLLPLTLL
jgi:hypothetical protein